MSSSHGDYPKHTGRERVGLGSRIQEFPVGERRVFKDFGAGYNVADSEADIQENQSPYMIDMIISSKDELIRVPGVTELEAFAGRNPTNMVLHAAADFTSELVLFAPPELGVKADAATIWTNIGLLVGTKYVASNYGGILVFTGGLDRLYYRDPHGSAIVVTDGPPGRTITTFAGRIFVGDTLIDGNSEPLGIAWSGSLGDHTDWTGLGSGHEFLIADMPAGDGIIAIRPVDLDTLAILCRNSLWIGRRTGFDAPPVEFSPRIRGQGCVSEASVQVVEGGVLYLADDGVKLFTINEAQHVSAPIDKDLLPLNQGALDSYTSAFNKIRQWYYLFTPTQTWVLDWKYKRWYRMSTTYARGVHFPIQGAYTTWDQVVGNWDAQLLTWEDFLIREGLQRFILLKGNKIGNEDDAVQTILGNAVVPTWTSPVSIDEMAERVYTTRELTIRYNGSGTLGIALPDLNGDFVTQTPNVLPSATVKRTERRGLFNSGIGMGVRLTYIEGSPVLDRAVLEGVARGPRIGMLTPYVAPAGGITVLGHYIGAPGDGNYIGNYQGA